MKITSEGYLISEEEFKSIIAIEENGKKNYLIRKMKDIKKEAVAACDIEQMILDGKNRNTCLKESLMTEYHFKSFLKKKYGTDKFTAIKVKVFEKVNNL
jgi:hypothetical protein